jgi:hypothetical protein
LCGFLRDIVRISPASGNKDEHFAENIGIAQCKSSNQKEYRHA